MGVGETKREHRVRGLSFQVGKQVYQWVTENSLSVRLVKVVGFVIQTESLTPGQETYCLLLSALSQTGKRRRPIDTGPIFKLT